MVIFDFQGSCDVQGRALSGARRWSPSPAPGRSQVSSKRAGKKGPARRWLEPAASPRGCTQRPRQHQPGRRLRPQSAGSSPSPYSRLVLTVLSPAWPVQYVRIPVSRRGRASYLPLQVPAKKTKHPQAAGYPDGAAPPPGLGRACGDRTESAGRGEKRRSGWRRAAESHAHRAASLLTPAPGRLAARVSSVQLSRSVVFATTWTAARQASLSITNSRSLLKLMSIESVMPSNHVILCRPLLLPSIFPSIRVFSSESVLRIRWPRHQSFQ